MFQSQNRNYKTNESLAQQFWHTCLGKLTIGFGILLALLIFAHLTIPDEDTMMMEMTDNVYQCLEANDSIKTDDIDDAVNNLTNIFTTVEELPNKEVIEMYEKYNELKYHRHAFHATTRMYNNMHPDGTLAGIGLFGIVIPTINYSDMLLRTGIMHKGYDQKIIQSTVISGGESFGSDPELGL